MPISLQCKIVHVRWHRNHKCKLEWRLAKVSENSFQSLILIRDGICKLESGVWTDNTSLDWQLMSHDEDCNATEEKLHFDDQGWLSWFSSTFQCIAFHAQLQVSDGCVSKKEFVHPGLDKPKWSKKAKVTNNLATSFGL